MKDYHYECMIIILSHLAAETGEFINMLKNRGEVVDNAISDKLDELNDILDEAREIWENN